MIFVAGNITNILVGARLQNNLIKTHFNPTLNQNFYIAPLVTQTGHEFMVLDKKITEIQKKSNMSKL
jgi:hypothetical protein